MSDNNHFNSESNYFKYLANEGIKNILVEKWKFWRWILGIILVFLAGVATFVGIRMDNIGDKFINLKADMNYLETSADSLVNEIKIKEDVLNKMISLNQKTLDIMLKNMDIQSRNNEGYLLMQRDNLNMLTNQSHIIFKEYTLLKEDLTNRSLSAKDKIDSLTLFENRIKNKIINLDSISNEVKISSSARYLFVERGDRKLGELEYRASPKINLPYSDSTIYAVFYNYDVSKDEQGIVRKEAYVDILIENKYKKVVLNKPYILKEFDAQRLNDNPYHIEAQFIYLPPNSWGLIYPLAVSIPDFVNLRIYLSR